ncbi:MAG: DedA family protein [Gammaproteobacteria bacterium]|nr:DedA family protein [Gammaproteobacteria bacterium]
MRLFEKLYQAVIRFARYKHAPWYLSGLSFLESFILPFPPPDVMLAPMSLATPGKAMYFASLTLVSSVIGGIVGYLIGAFLFDQVEPLLLQWGYQSAVDTVTQWFDAWGFWAVVIAGFSPVPYKIFTITAGALGLSFIPFVIASFIGRGARFFLVAWSLAKFGPAIETKLIAYIERLGWGIVTVLVIVIAIYYT